jgi:hypothetical protein
VSQLLDIQKLQFSQRDEAERRMLALLKSTYRDDIARLELNPKPESLNSLNGFVTLADGTRYFFKTHTEENERLDSYYNARSLAEAGYPVVIAQEVNTIPGQQIALYEVIDYPTLFDLVKTQEDKLLAKKGKGVGVDSSANLTDEARRLVGLQKDLDKKVCAAYGQTLEKDSDERLAPVHQLFSHRLAAGGRVDLFYKSAALMLGERRVPFDELSQWQWRINGVTYDGTLASLIADARKRLAPQEGIATVVGHGDAHNGNVFVDQAGERLLYFDPAFAGRHDPILDMAKPMFHNVFARWMYFPQEVAEECAIAGRVEDGRIVVEHDFSPSQIRREFLRSKLQFALRPLLPRLSEAGLSADWVFRLRSALFACSFLTVNLLAEHKASGSLAERYPDSIRLLGLCMAVEMAADVVGGKNEISALVDEITAVWQCSVKMREKKGS